MNFWAKAPLNLVADLVKNSVPPLLRTLRFYVGRQEIERQGHSTDHIGRSGSWVAFQMHEPKGLVTRDLFGLRHTAGRTVGGRSLQSGPSGMLTTDPPLLQGPTGVGEGSSKSHGSGRHGVGGDSQGAGIGGGHRR